MFSSAGVCSLALLNRRPAGAESRLTRNVASPFHAEPAQEQAKPPREALFGFVWEVGLLGKCRGPRFSPLRRARVGSIRRCLSATYPFSEKASVRDHAKNWSNGQYNFAPPCAMLILENFRMTSAETSVGSPLNLPALSLPNVPRTEPRTAWCRAELRGFRCNSNRNRVRIEIVTTHRKQRRASNSNRNSFRGSTER
jgi:hypothetical protein